LTCGLNSGKNAVMGRKVKKSASRLAILSLAVCFISLGIGYYIQVQLRPYRIFYPFTSTERAWRDQAFDVAMISFIVAVGLLLVARKLRI